MMSFIINFSLPSSGEVSTSLPSHIPPGHYEASILCRPSFTIRDASEPTLALQLQAPCTINAFSQDSSSWFTVALLDEWRSDSVPVTLRDPSGQSFNLRLVDDATSSVPANLREGTVVLKLTSIKI